jgi:hypothetical protein
MSTISELETLIDRRIGNPVASPNGQTIALRRLSDNLKISIDALRDLAREKGVPVRFVERSSRIEGRDLSTLIGEPRARQFLLEGRPDFLRTDPASFYIPVARSELPTLCRLRGVAESHQGGNPVFATLGLIMLAAVIQAEQKQELPADDWIPWRDAIERLRDSQHFRRTEQVQDFAIERSEGAYVAAINEIEARCNASAIRTKTPVHRGQRGELVVCSYDLFRMAGIEMPGKDVEFYRLMMIEAFDSILGQEGVAS